MYVFSGGIDYCSESINGHRVYNLNYNQQWQVVKLEQAFGLAVRTPGKCHSSVTGFQPWFPSQFQFPALTAQWLALGHQCGSPGFNPQLPASLQGFRE